VSADPRAEAYAAAHRLKGFLAANPLAVARLWQPKGWTPERTSQREAMRRLLGTPDLLVFVLLGGNRSGKTEAGAQLVVAVALGSDHPAVQLWSRVNGIPIDRVQPGPGVVCCSALTGNESIRIQRPKVEAYRPAGSRWSNRHGHGEASVRLPNGGVILFKSNDQRERAFQGADWDMLWLDEEHDEPVFNEGRMRLADRAGLAVFTMTPLKGKTWVYRRFVEEPEDGSASYALNSRDNPHVPQDYLERLLAQYGPHERAARERGEFTALEGRVFEFYRHLHVVEAFDPPEDWQRFQGWDFGTRNPTAVVWCALDPSDDVLHVYREHYKAGWTVKQHAERVHELEACETCLGEPVQPSVDVDDSWLYPDDPEVVAAGFCDRVDGLRVCPGCLGRGRREPLPEWRVGDPAAKSERLTLAREHDLQTVKGRNDVRPGLNSVAERLAPDVEGRAHLVVHDSCPRLVGEFEGYVWKTTRGSKADPKDEPLKRDDHALDALRYVVFRLKRGQGSLA